MAGTNWSNGFVNVAWSRLDPSCNSVDVLKETDKAVQLKTGNCVAWFPKSAFKIDKYGTALEVCQWFKAKMTRYQMKAIGFAS
jgi:hypothetical protein